MKRKTIRFLLPLLCGLAVNTAAVFTAAVLGACHLENKADPFAGGGLSLPDDFATRRAALETTVKAEARAALNVINSGANAQTIRPSPASRATACCWAHSTASSLNDFDRAQGWTNTHSDQCPPSNALTYSGSGWWNMNYARPNNATYPGKKHTEIPANERIDEGNHWLTVDVTGSPVNILGFTYLARNASGDTNIDRYQVYISDQLLGHNPPPGSFVYEGNLQDGVTTRQTVNFMPRRGRYIQIRVLTSHRGGGMDGGMQQFEAITVDKTPEQMAGEITAAMELIQQEHQLSIDYEYLNLAYQEGLRTLNLPLVRNNPNRFNPLNDLLKGTFDGQGNVVKKGAFQYMNDDPDEPKTIQSEADLNAFFEYQKSVDAITQQLVVVVEIYNTKTN